MTKTRFASISAALFVVAGLQPFCGAAAPGPAPDVKEVLDLLRAHLSGLSADELNQKAVDALAAGFGPRVSLLPGGATNNSGSQLLPVSKTALFDGTLAYVRVEQVSSGLPAAVRSAWERMQATNRLQGLVLDLRYATGTDYAAAADTADLFLKGDRPLLDHGTGLVRSRDKTDAIGVPVAVLINGRTAGAAEALAAVARETSAGLLLGNRTAGQAMVTKDFPLSNGQLLRIAVGALRLGDGSNMPSDGVQPDVSVEVTPEDERAYFADAFRVIARTNLGTAGASSPVAAAASTNRADRRTRMSEAELVRQRREGLNPDVEIAPAREDEPEKPVVHDPVLARALDLLKGLAVVRKSRS